MHVVYIALLVAAIGYHTRTSTFKPPQRSGISSKFLAVLKGTCMTVVVHVHVYMYICFT